MPRYSFLQRKITKELQTKNCKYHLRRRMTFTGSREHFLLMPITECFIAYGLLSGEYVRGASFLSASLFQNFAVDWASGMIRVQDISCGRKFFFTTDRDTVCLRLFLTPKTVKSASAPLPAFYDHVSAIDAGFSFPAVGQQLVLIFSHPSV